MVADVLPGKSFPLGSTTYDDGVNFCIFSKHAEALELLLFDQPTSPQPSRVIRLDPQSNRTFYYWHIFVKGLTTGQVYAYRAYGPFAPDQGHRFNPKKVLLDPYAKSIVGEEIYDRKAAIHAEDNCAQALRAVVVDNRTYDWEGDHPLRTPYSKSVIYEMHVGGFTRHPNSGLPLAKRGTYAGLIEKIPYLKKLGITAVELMPVHYFDPEDAQPGLTNYWGYSTIGFFAPYRGYSSRKDPMGPVDEFRDMVKALHREGIEVILDVVFNHTAEGNHTGPTLSFRGLDNATYYILEADNPALYTNYSGCGNTVKANHPSVGRMILECLHYWVAEMHVDGFRFDLASVLARDALGKPLQERITVTPDILWIIESDPILAGTKLIAEAWDAAGLYQVGQFVEFADWFAEWNGPFRDDVRRFVKSDLGSVNQLAARILGSPDIYSRPNTDVNRSINFITCHDGFTLHDLVAYNEKHNEANREKNVDGSNDNHSWNCGEEGETDDPKILALRMQQIKNLLTILFMSQGTPMILMGDEIGRTQQGNNNAYCQDNELSWFDWEETDRQSDLRHFVSRLIHFIQSLELFNQERLLKVAHTSFEPHISWHGVKLEQPDWSYHSHTLAFSLQDPEADEYLHVILNAYWEPLQFELPPLGHGDCWHCVIDTALSLPATFSQLDAATPVKDHYYEVEARSCVVLIVKPVILTNHHL
jgi:glycogen operon protein